MYEGIDKDEQKIAKRLVRAILGRGWVISVFDGEETTLVRSADFDAVIDAMGSTDYDQLGVFDAEGKSLGAIMLIWSNGEDLISDHSDNRPMNDLMEQLA